MNMEKILKFTIYGNPITKKNSANIFYNRKTGRPFISPSKQYKEYANNFLAQAMEQKLLGKKLSGRYNVKCMYYMKTKRKVDLTNLLEATDDCLVNAGIIVDDNCEIVAGHDGSRVYHDKENPRVEVEICEEREFEI